MRSGWSSRAGSQVSVDEEELIKKLKPDLKDYIHKAQNKDFVKLNENITHILKEASEIPQNEELNVKICSSHFMFNMT